MADRFSEAVTKMLLKAGWTEGRKVDPVHGLSEPSAVFPKAEEILTEFRGLHVGKCGAGVDFARSDVEFEPDLSLLAELKEHEASTGARLFPLGEAVRGHIYLIVDERGEIYLLVEGELEAFAPSFPQALEMLLLGKKMD